METIKFIYYQEEDMFVGWLEEYPDYRTQGETHRQNAEVKAEAWHNQDLVC
jgi:hypothetical protein